MEWVETTGRTVEEAKEAALDQLGVDEQDAEFEIVEEARFGLFGRLRSEARVRARVRPTKPRAKEDRRDRRGRRKGPGADGPGSAAPPGSAGAAGAAGAAGSAGSAGGDDSPAQPARSAPGGDGAAPVRAAARSQPGSAPTDGDPGAAGNRRNRRGRGPGSGTTANNRGGSARGTRRPDEENDDDTTSQGGGMDVALDEQGAVAKEFLDGLVERMSLDAEVAITEPEDDTIELNLHGQDLGLLIGPKGSTLLAIQDLTRTVVQRKTSAANGRILVDVSGYRRKRKDALVRFTRQVADEVVASGTRRVLEPMSAADRKIVHDTVNDIDGVATTSEGEEPHRRVVILPVAADNADN